jgi:hypothetical protein
MAEAPGYLIGPRLLTQIQSAVRHYVQIYGGGEAGKVRQQTQERRWAILDADLLAAVDMFTDPSTATAHLIGRTDAGDLEVLDEQVTVVNRFENISIDADTLIGIEYMCGEWTPYKADCGPNSQGASSLLASISPGASVGGP